MTKTIKKFQYKKNNNEYWDKAKLYQQVINKLVLIAKALYLNYSLVFLFDNTTSYFVYIKDILQTKNINKNLRGK